MLSSLVKAEDSNLEARTIVSLAPEEEIPFLRRTENLALGLGITTVERKQVVEIL